MTKPTPPSDMWERLESAEIKAGTTVMNALESGWFSRIEYAERHGCSRSSAGSRLAKLVELGTLETKTVKIAVGGTVQTVRAYHLKETS